ncbi:phosphatidylinositol transfer protein 3 isoform X2 [Ricinus communis]|uniref:phosphatidylinositol transfer protein 3 isoform X2 n=1 Tax=Ricinus communis TaxID=3988 RepID=UPI00201A8C4B|nr:phosphatidylinositol transfer protein 3 isoform X2 [Ricinus communis]
MSTGVKKSPSNGFEKALTIEEQQAKINEVRKLVGSLPEKLSIYCSDASITRHLKARNWNVKKAMKMLKETLKWRAEYKPEEIRWNSKSIKGQIKYLVYCMENAILNLPPNQEQMVWLIDFHGFNLSHISLKVTKETAHVLQDHYPERLGLAILYNPPKFFEPFWMVAKAFLEPKTFNKVKFVYSDVANTMKIMEDLFDMDHLESAFGGKDGAGFDINTYAERMREDDKKMPSFWTRGSPASVIPEPALTSAASLDLNVDSHSDTSETDETDSSYLKGIDLEIVSPEENMPVADSGTRTSENMLPDKLVTHDNKANV